MSPIELGKFIATLRNEKNLTQEELADKLYIDKRKISRWECGTSMPEFDMLIKLSEILDVSLYELSICKRIENESLPRKIINKFKNINDFKKYSIRKKIRIIINIIFIILFIITLVYTVKYSNSVAIYELQSMDDNYYINGNYVEAKELNLFNIKHIGTKGKTRKKLVDCEYEIYSNNTRFFYIPNDSDKLTSYHELDKPNKLNSIITLNGKCKNNDSFSFDIKLIKKYDNKLF